MNVKLLREDAKIPTKANETDAGWDLYAAEDVTINGGERGVVKTGIALQIPDGYVGLIWPRSGLAVKKGLDVLAGVIDAGYRGEIMVCLFNTSLPVIPEKADMRHAIRVHIKKGDKIAQILFQEVAPFQMYAVEELADSVRGESGFGSTGQ